MRRERIDKLLVERGLADSRTKAQAMVMAGVVLVNDQRVEKASEQFPTDSQIRIKHADDPTSRYVGRGGLKLEAALREFQIDVRGAVCLDVGASTGGFTDCLLQHGAKHVFAIDVGHGQLAWKLRQDPRVVVMEKTNARYLTAAQFPKPFSPDDLIVADCSFISLRKILPPAVPLLRPAGRIVALVKPQFEAGKEAVSRGRGVIRDAAVRERAIGDARLAVTNAGFVIHAEIDSALPGPKGNVERFLYAGRGP